MDLNRTEMPSRIIYNGTTELTATAGQVVRIETTPDGTEDQTVEVPAGKQWTVNAHLSITETDV